MLRSMGWWNSLRRRTNEATPAAPQPSELALDDEASWLVEAQRCASEIWKYNYSSLRPGAVPRRVWHEYPLATVFLADVNGTGAATTGTVVFVGNAPATCSFGHKTVADALRDAARQLEWAAKEIDRERNPAAWPFVPAPEGHSQRLREIAARLLQRASQPDANDQLV